MKTLTKEQEQAKKLIQDLIQFLNGTGSFFRNGNEVKAARDLWAVLTALRGPDSRSREVKMRTTARIRGAIGLKVDVGIPADISINPPYHEILPSNESAHFEDHYNHAVSALYELGFIEQINASTENKA